MYGAEVPFWDDKCPLNFWGKGKNSRPHKNCILVSESVTDVMC